LRDLAWPLPRGVLFFGGLILAALLGILAMRPGAGLPRALTAIGCLVIVETAYLLGEGNVIDAFNPLAALGSIVACCWAVTRDPRWIFAAYPLFYFAAAALSSAGNLDSYALGMALMILAIGLAGGLNVYWNSLFLAGCAAVAVAGFVYKIRHPYEWIAYKAPPLLAQTQWHHQTLVDRELSSLIDPVCAGVAGHSLLSIPYGYANYYCGVPQWKGYVQTWYDTTTRRRIDALLGDLAHPPEYILYQRQVAVMAMHEAIFHHGQPLPHRALDALIMDRIASGQWTVVYTSAAYPPSQWILVRTSAGQTEPPPRRVASASDRFLRSRD
jgi:hypothetical protein